MSNVAQKRAAGPKRATNVSLPIAMVSEAKAIGINVSQACEQGLAAELKRAREQAWLRENREAIEESNRWVEEHGLPLERYRLF